MKLYKTIGKQSGTIVFLHGSSSSSKVFTDILQTTQILHTRIAIELAGHGHNNKSSFKEEDFSVLSYCNELITVINEIEDDIILVGNSLGGHLAIEVCQYIKRLKALVIYGTPPVKKPINMEEAFLPEPALQTFFTENPTEDEIATASISAVYNRKHSNVIKEDFLRANPLVRKQIATDIINNSFNDQYKIFTELSIPKYIITGEMDPTVNPIYLEQIKENCREHCSIIPFSNCGHYASLEKPEEFISTIKMISEKAFT